MTDPTASHRPAATLTGLDLRESKLRPSAAYAHPWPAGWPCPEVVAIDKELDRLRSREHSGGREHVTDGDGPLACWCGPYRDTEEPEVIIHRKEGEA